MNTDDRTTRPRALRHEVEPSFDGRTVLAVLRRAMLVSDATVRRAKRIEGGITLDGVRCKTNQITRTGQVVGIVIEDAARTGEGGNPHGQASTVKAEAGALSIAYEDDDILVIDKPAGLVVHPGPGHENGTLCNFVAHHLKTAGSAGTARPVQRLDRTTSGLMVFAKNAHAQDRLQRQMHTCDFQRTYLAICTGAPSPACGIVDAPIARISRGPSVFAVREDGKRAVTRYETLARWTHENAGQTRASSKAGGRCGCEAESGGDGGSGRACAVGLGRGKGALREPVPETLSLVKLDLETGRTHQIRLHMRHIGCPLLGDETYGAASGIIGRAALHSWRLHLTHPLTGELVELTCELPQDMQDVLAGSGPSVCGML